MTWFGNGQRLPQKNSTGFVFDKQRSLSEGRFILKSKLLRNSCAVSSVSVFVQHVLLLESYWRLLSTTCSTILMFCTLDLSVNLKNSRLEIKLTLTE